MKAKENILIEEKIHPSCLESEVPIESRLPALEVSWKDMFFLWMVSKNSFWTFLTVNSLKRVLEAEEKIERKKLTQYNAKNIIAVIKITLGPEYIALSKKNFNTKGIVTVTAVVRINKK